MDRMLLSDHDEIRAILQRHHEATALKNVGALQNVFHEYALFIGTDDKEKWTRSQLLEALKGTESGWDMTECHERHVYAVPGWPYMATFFEVVKHTKYGRLRGVGTVIEERGVWGISLYSLSFSVPNKLVDKTNILELLAQ